MANYKCFFCGKQLSSKNLEKRFVCPNCNGRVFFKPREAVKRVKAV
ncbi:MAG: DNA-directed RNA polymerase subunit P [archaeon]